MVNRHGQSMTEFLFVLGLLTLLGTYILHTWIGLDGKSGVSGITVYNASKKIQSDKP